MELHYLWPLFIQRYPDFFQLRIVNANYLLVENEINKCVFGDFEELLNMDEKKTLNAAAGLAKEIFNLVV